MKLQIESELCYHLHIITITLKLIFHPLAFSNPLQVTLL